MLSFACGTCGISALSVALPWLDEWVWLGLAAMLLGSAYDYQEGELRRKLLGQLIGLALGFVLSAMMLAGLIIPIWLIYAFVRVLTCLIRGGKVLRGAALVWLLLCLGSAAWRGYQASRLPRQDYLMTRFLAGGPGQAYLSELAKQQPFPLEETMQKLIQGSPREARNASKLLELRAFRKEPDESEKIRMKSWLAQVPATRQEERVRVETAYKL